ncbi:MAG: 1-acyl-sn-glycerol-3-phosphate acyltransferase [Actinomycetota bacterium]|nr:1-acyl-sn-glycerol-3-phosphate acyltransferase [Actinomycetota bacterium]MDQ2957411.1 1-acyl-sn-glycerol-3-phosphate acyltransferase [Actinomycetota bacterium]
MAEPAGLREYPRWDFSQLDRWGPTLAERATGSARLRGWQRVGRLFCTVLGQVQFEGLERIPDNGAAILVINHTSALDGALLFGFSERTVSFLVKAEAFEPAAGLAGRILIQGAQVPVRRGWIDPSPVRLSLDLLEQGALLGICPEGARGDGRVRQVRPGVGYFALKSGAPVVPIAIHGSAAMVHRSPWRRVPVRVVVGEPLSFERAQPGPLNRRRWVAATEQIRARMAELVRATEPDPAVVTARTRVDQ